MLIKTGETHYMCECLRRTANLAQHNTDAFDPCCAIVLPRHRIITFLSRCTIPKQALLSWRIKISDAFKWGAVIAFLCLIINNSDMSRPISISAILQPLWCSNIFSVQSYAPIVWLFPPCVADMNTVLLHVCISVVHRSFEWKGFCSLVCEIIRPSAQTYVHDNYALCLICSQQVVIKASKPEGNQCNGRTTVISTIGNQCPS